MAAQCKFVSFVFRATGGSRAIIQFHGGYHFLHIPERRTHFAIMICVRPRARAQERKRDLLPRGDLSTAISDGESRPVFRLADTTTRGRVTQQRRSRPGR